MLKHDCSRSKCHCGYYSYFLGYTNISLANQSQLVFKICEKIATKEPFTVYILLPMWMEGIPQDGATQGLLYFQRNTIEAMYKHVQKALDARMANSSDFGLKCLDYLNFYCLGTRETKDRSQATAESVTDDEKLLSETRRHQIYIHSVSTSVFSL